MVDRRAPARRRRRFLFVLTPVAVVALMGTIEVASGLVSPQQEEQSASSRLRLLFGARERAPDPEPRAARPPVRGAINPDVPGITTFRGNLTRSYYGEGPVPRRPEIRWRYPSSGGLCSPSTDETGTKSWCGVGWTGQPNVIPSAGGRLELRFGAYDSSYHFLNARTGRQLREDLPTGDLAKGSATSDPDGYPLYYAGSRDDQFRIVALDRKHDVSDQRRAPPELWQVGLDGCIEATPSVWKGLVFVGTRAGGMYALGDRRRIAPG